jgi:hypothetical protein
MGHRIGPVAAELSRGDTIELAYEVHRDGPGWVSGGTIEATVKRNRLSDEAGKLTAETSERSDSVRVEVWGGGALRLRRRRNAAVEAGRVRRWRSGSLSGEPTYPAP